MIDNFESTELDKQFNKRCDERREERKALKLTLLEDISKSGISIHDAKIVLKDIKSMLELFTPSLPNFPDVKDFLSLLDDRKYV